MRSVETSIYSLADGPSADLFVLQLAGAISLPPGLLTNLQHIALPPLFYHELSLNVSLSLPSSSCIFHCQPGEIPNELLVDPRVQEIADALNLAGGRRQYWQQEYLPRIASDVARIARSFPKLLTFEQELLWGDCRQPSLVWEIERRPGGTTGDGGEGEEVCAVRPRSIGSGGWVYETDDAGYCTCSKEGEDECRVGAKMTDWWAFHTFQNSPLRTGTQLLPCLQAR